MQAKTERFEMRLDQETLESVDGWRRNQRDLPSRAEAIRRLVERGLSPSEKNGVQLSDGEKLILIMLSDVYEHLKIRGKVEPAFIVDAISGGHYWGLRWQYPWVFDEHTDNPHILSEVVDILDMWSFLERGYNNLSAKDKALVEKEATPFGTDVRFRGFDGTNEIEHLGITQFLIDQLERFPSFHGRHLNSHAPSIDAYRRMLCCFAPMRQKLMGRELAASEIIEILKEMLHPEHRTKTIA